MRSKDPCYTETPRAPSPNSAGYNCRELVLGEWDEAAAGEDGFRRGHGHAAERRITRFPSNTDTKAVRVGAHRQGGRGTVPNGIHVSPLDYCFCSLIDSGNPGHNPVKGTAGE